MSEAIATAEPHQAPLSAVQRVINVYAAPSKTFQDILANGKKLLLPILLLIIGSYIFTFTAAHRVGYDVMAESALRVNPSMAERMQSMPAEQVATIHKQQEIGMHVTTYTFPLVYVLIGAIYALLLLPTLNFALGGEATYSNVFAVVIYSFLVGLVKFLVAALVLWVTEPPETFLLQDPVGSNPGYYLDQPSGVLYSFLSSFDVIEIWQLIVMGIGCAIVAKLSLKKGVIAVFAWWALVLIVKVSIAAAFS